MISLFRAFGLGMLVSATLLSTAEAKLGGFEPEDGYAWYYQTDFHRYNAGQYSSSVGTETPPFQSIPLNTGLWLSNAGLDPSVAGSYIGAHPGGRNGVAKMAIKSMSYSAGNFDMDYHFDSLDFDGNNPGTIKNATVEISYWFCPSVNNLPGVTDTISFFGANGNHLVSLGTKYDNASPRLVYSTTSHTSGWVDTGLNANPGDWDQVQLLITLSTVASDRLTLSFVSSLTGNTTVLLNDVVLAANIDALHKLKFTHNKDAINGKYYYDDFEFSVTNIQNPCEITGLVVTPGVCNNNGTPNDTTDDYYDASVTASFQNKPSSGNLELSGASLHATNSVSSVAVASTTSATSHTFAGVRLKANGLANSLTATFSADTACALTVSPSAVGACSVPDCDISNFAVSPGACNDNGTPDDASDDSFTATVTITFSDKPSTGNLVLSGAALHSSNTVTSVAVGSTTSTTTHIFTGVMLKANNLANALTVTFSADPSCTLTQNAPSVTDCSETPVNCCPQLMIDIP